MRYCRNTFNYSNTRATYEAYRKAGYSRKFFEAHREEITIHKAAKKAFDELGVKRIPKVKDLNAEYARLMAEKKQTFAEYRKARDEVKEYLVVREISLPSMRRSARKMKLTGNGSRNRNDKNTGPGICEKCRCSGLGLFHFSNNKNDGICDF